MRENARTKADRLLLEARLTVEQVIPGSVRATCRGEGHRWHQAYEHGTWSCDCPARTTCSHLHALRRVIAIDLTENR